MKPEKVVKLVQDHMATLDCGCSAIVRKNFVILRIRPDERHFWSPQLSLSFELDEKMNRSRLFVGYMVQTQLFGHYSPIAT